WLVFAARAADRVRRGSLLYPVARRQVWLAVLAPIAAVETLVFALRDRAVSWIAYAAWLLAVAAPPLIAWLALLDHRAAKRFALATTNVTPRDPSAPLPTDGTLLDLGVGDEVHAPSADSAHPYRASSDAATVLGSLALTRRALARARVRNAICFAIAVAAAISTTYVLAHLPAPAGAEKPLDFAPLFHC
ncbi:MAG TPA: hypothetical protein VFF06_25520, partial [Polyangia bacterium]|nr:hypothetical protein [Polyangia bacterium]